MHYQPFGISPISGGKFDKVKAGGGQQTGKPAALHPLRLNADTCGVVNLQISIMKEHVQEYGVRRWAGDDLVELQSEPLEAIQKLVEPYAPCIIQGCEVNATEKRIGSGMVALWERVRFRHCFCECFSPV